jgi:DNA-binding NtrC family response regulator
MRGKSESEAPIETSPAHRTGEDSPGQQTLFLQGLNAEPRFVSLSRSAVLFGRESDCQVVIANSEASRHHAEIVRVGPIHILRDLGSRNGTFLNGRPITEAPLAPGAILRIGGWLACVRVGADEQGEQSFTMQGPDLWGGSALRAELASAQAAARSKLPIVLEGETGTGKELVARALHAWSGRGGPFVALNCAALPEALAEGELFGYRRGAFTGAERAHAGYFRAAHGGTLLLDEICDLPLSLQAKLLRVLEQQEVVPLGESTPVPIDVRFVAAAQEPLRAAVEQRRFRADLYARLEGLTVRLAPLRERREDILGLLEQFVREHDPGVALEFTTNALEALHLYDWPFNLRELKLLAQRLASLRAGLGNIHRRDLPERMRQRPQTPEGTALEQAVDAEPELTRFVAALREQRGNVTRAAQAARISRMRAYRLMHAHPDLDLASFRRDDVKVDANVG